MRGLCGRRGGRRKLGFALRRERAAVVVVMLWMMTAMPMLLHSRKEALRRLPSTGVTRDIAT